MRALRWYGREDLRLEDGTEPSADPGQVVIEVRWCGICGTDLHEYLKGPIFVPIEPHPVSGIAAPLTLGQEFTGRIRRAGRRGQVAEGRRPRDRRRRPEMRPLPLLPERPVHPLRVAGFVGLASNRAEVSTATPSLVSESMKKIPLSALVPGAFGRTRIGEMGEDPGAAR